MTSALRLAEQAYACHETPIGAVIVKDGQIIASAYNQKEQEHCATRHAELIAIEIASQKLNNFRLLDCDLYVTLEPCLMCAGAIYQARLRSVYFSAFDPKAGALGSLYSIHEDKRLNHRFSVFSGLLENESRNLLKSFFQQRR